MPRSFRSEWESLVAKAEDEQRRAVIDKACGVIDLGIGTMRDPFPDTIADPIGPSFLTTVHAKTSYSYTKSHAAGDAGSGNAPTRTSPRCDSSSAAVASVYPLVTLCLAHGLTAPIPEYRFHAVRKWRFDYAWPLTRIAVEIEGGVWTQGRHTRGAGAIEDMRKYSAAALLGWRILYYQPSELSLAIADLRVEFAKGS